jgi:hypothetical protein
LRTHKNETDILFHDGTEREIPRPQDEEEQKENYIGKKKAYCQECGNCFLLLYDTVCQSDALWKRS